MLERPETTAKTDIAEAGEDVAASLVLARFLPYRLAVLAARVSRRLAASYRDEFGLTIPEWRVMSHLARANRISVRDIHNCVNLDKPAVSRAVTALVDKGLVERVAHPDDKRLLELSLSRAGRTLYARVAVVATDVEAELLACLDTDERAMLSTIIEKLNRKLDDDPLAPGRAEIDRKTFERG